MCKILRGAALDSKLKKMKTPFQLEPEVFVDYSLQMYKALSKHGNKSVFAAERQILDAVDSGFLHPYNIRNLVKVEVL